MHGFAMKRRKKQLEMTKTSTSRELVNKYRYILSMVSNATIKKNESDLYLYVQM